MVRKKVEEVPEQKTQEVHKRLTHARNRKDKVNEALEALQEFTEQGGSVLSAKYKNKSLTLNQTVLKTCESETDYLRKILLEIEKIKKAEVAVQMKNPIKRHALMQLINFQGRSLPLYVGGADGGFPPPYVGAIHIPDTIALNLGDSVAALVDENWILAEISEVLPNMRYEVKDIEGDSKVRHTIVRKHLIPLPKYRADPERDQHALFPLDAIVLALYPQTTCFYKGVVHRVPQKAIDNYMVAFEDPSYQSGFSPPLPIPQRYVVTFKEEVKIKGRKKTEKVNHDDD